LLSNPTVRKIPMRNSAPKILIPYS
jgi:hypothetical protein